MLGALAAVASCERGRDSRVNLRRLGGYRRVTLDPRISWDTWNCSDQNLPQGGDQWRHSSCWLKSCVKSSSGNENKKFIDNQSANFPRLFRSVVWKAVREA